MELSRTFGRHPTFIHVTCGPGHRSVGADVGTLSRCRDFVPTPSASAVRKVRTPQGSVLPNGKAASIPTPVGTVRKARATESSPAPMSRLRLDVETLS